MSESCREQHPLLYEDLSEEEHFSPRYHRRFGPMSYKGRTKSNYKGAAAIIRLWPEHWSTSVTYWWIALGMIGLITIIVYNSVIVFAMLPNDHHYKELRHQTENTLTPVIEEARLTVNVYMHIFVDNNQELDLNNYMPYIDIIANKYPDFKYHLIIVLNDSSLDTKDFSAEENNEIALNLLWAKNSAQHSEKNNVVLEHTTLSKYMNNSPLKQYWRKLPKQFMQFLIRAVSIWDKGGIAFNPTILTPMSPHAIYIEKIQNILKNYHNDIKKIPVERKIIKKQHNSIKKRVNNIRDIIDALENDDEDLFGMSQDSPIDEEMQRKTRAKNITHTAYPSPVHSSRNVTTNSHNVHPKFNHLLKNKSIVDANLPENKEILVMAESKVNNVSVELQTNNDTSAIGILPMFLEFLFRNKPSQSESIHNLHNVLPKVTRKRKHAPIDKGYTDQYSDHFDKRANKTLRSIIIPTNTKSSESDSEKAGEPNNVKSEDNTQFTIDLKGNIVSSGIPCHAFLGTMFGNAIHHIEESLTDFIITELSIFCKGALSSCKGIDVILL